MTVELPFLPFGNLTYPMTINRHKMGLKESKDRTNCGGLHYCLPHCF